MIDTLSVAAFWAVAAAVVVLFGLRAWTKTLRDIRGTKQETGSR